jgi:hypothetical protein
VKTYSLFERFDPSRIVADVFAIHSATEGRQGAPLLEHCRE